MVEDAVQQDPHPALGGPLDQLGQVLLGAEPGVDAEVVGGVVAVGLGGEHRSQGEAVAAQREEVVEPVGQHRQAVARRLARGQGGALGSEEAEG